VRSRLEDVTASLARHLSRSHAVQFLLNERREGIQGAFDLHDPRRLTGR
jgi:hypothetical protein